MRDDPSQPKCQRCGKPMELVTAATHQGEVIKLFRCDTCQTQKTISEPKR